MKHLWHGKIPDNNVFEMSWALDNWVSDQYILYSLAANKSFDSPSESSWRLGELNPFWVSSVDGVEQEDGESACPGNNSLSGG